MIHYSRVCLHTFAHVLPPHVISSEEIEERLSSVYSRLKLPKGRLELMSGIKERRFWDKGTKPSQAAAQAGLKVLEKAEISADAIECLIFSSVCRDMMEPSTASFIHHMLGLSAHCLIFDLSNACLGFLDGMVMLANMIELGQVKNGLILSGETAEDLLESTLTNLCADRELSRKSIKPAFASLTIGSGAVGLLMTRTEESSGMLLSCGAWQANTSFSNLCHGGTAGEEGILMETNSEELLIQGIETAAATWQCFSAFRGWTEPEIDRFFCHQVGRAHAKLLFERLKLDPQKNFETLQNFGNIGSVSAPLTLAMAIEQGAFIPGQKGALLGIGSGINCMMLGIEWKGNAHGINDSTEAASLFNGSPCS